MKLHFFTPHGKVNIIYILGMHNKKEKNIQNIEKDSESENSDEENENVRGMRLRDGKRTVTFSQ